MSPNAGGGGSCGVSANEYSCTHGTQINFGDLTPYLTMSVRFNSTFAKRDKKQALTDLLGISTNWFKTSNVFQNGEVRPPNKDFVYLTHV
jgi:hypothetical protein